MTVGRLFGVRIRLNRFFLLLLVLLGFGGLLPQALVIFGVVFIHEFAHVVTARSCGLKVKEIELLPFGGVARIDDLVEIDPGVEISVALAGPLTNLFLVAVGVVGSRFHVVPAEWILFFVETNLLIGGFNLLPALPLDGGRVLRARLASRIGFRRATDRAVQIGKLSAVLLCAAGLAAMYFGIANISVVVFALFVYFAAGKEQSLAMYVFMRHLARKKGELQQSKCLFSHHLVAHRETPLKDVTKHFAPKRYHVVWVLDRQGQIWGVAGEVEIIDRMFERGIDEKIGSVARELWPSE